MVNRAGSSSSADRYDELMVRRAALEQEVGRRLARHREEMLRLLPLTGGSFGGRMHGIRLAADGSLQATLTLRAAHGVESAVTLHAKPGGQVEEYIPAERESEVVAPIQARDESDERLSIVTALARKHLPVGAADDFLAMLRPALRLVRAGEGEPAVAQLGGLPTDGPVSNATAARREARFMRNAPSIESATLSRASLLHRPLETLSPSPRCH